MSKHRAARRPRAGARRAAPPGRAGGKAGVIALLAASRSAIVAVVIVDRDPRPVPTSSLETTDVGSTRVPDSAMPQPAPSQGVVAKRSKRKPAPRVTAPEPAVVPEQGPGVFDTASAAESAPPGATTYRVEVERDLPFDVHEVASFVEATLVDDRGWTSRHALARVEGDSDLRIVIASPETADSLCAPLDTGGRLSCRNGSNVVINAWRWQFGADSYTGQLEAYRRYVVNHETGHALGYGHVGCSAPGALAPVMLQQTKGLDGCVANPWPARVDLAGH